MTGSYFFHAIKTDRLLREHFEAWLRERLEDCRNEMESAGITEMVWLAKGKVRAIRDLQTQLEQSLNLLPDSNEPEVAATKPYRKGLGDVPYRGGL